MKNARTVLTAVVLGVAFAATSCAATASSAATPLHHAAGRISAIVTSAKSLTLAVNGKTEQVSYTATTTIRVEGKNVATSIEILKTASPASATKSK